MIGTTLSHFKITAKLGEGGMGEVYRADDTKLGRQVAIKVLPETLAGDAERLARFEREAKVLASLNHPNIAGIYQVEQVEGTHFLAMELIDGEDLQQVIGRGSVPVNEALSFALQIAEALEAAHSRGIVHRDLKPANVMITADKKVKVLDFGLAKAVQSPSAEAEPHLSQSPTLTAQMTQAGTLLGTAAYMSPEQARGQEVDKRTDIWAFGCVLFELVTGTRAFGAETVSDCLVQILSQEPAWTELPDKTSASIRRVIQRCLTKDLSRRLHDIADARIDLEEADGDQRLTPPQPVTRSIWRDSIPWVVAAFALAIAVWMSLRAENQPPPKPVTRFVVTSEPLTIGGRPSGSQVAISPDGSILAYITGSLDSGQLYLRRLDSTESRIVEGASRASSPFFSPDSAWVGYRDGRELKRVSVDGGKARKICDVVWLAGANWGSDGTIVYADTVNYGLWLVRWDGGEPTRLTTVGRGGNEGAHVGPQFLPGGRRVLFSVMDSSGMATQVAIVDVSTGERQVVLETDGVVARYLASGHLAYGQDGSLMVMPFDINSGKVVGRAVAVLDDLLMGFPRSPHVTHLGVSDSGNLVYISGRMISTDARVVEVNRQGGAKTPIQSAEVIYGPRYSPAGRRVTMAARTPGSPVQVWVRDRERGTFTRLTPEEEGWWPLWSPDGTHVYFPSRPDSSMMTNLARVDADGSAPRELLTDGELGTQPTSWNPDGKTLIYHRNDHPDTGWDVMAINLDDGESQVVLGSRYNELLGSLSPDGHWLAYASDESGQMEVYIRSYPDLEDKWQISTDGGIEPTWSSSGQELFYRHEDGRTMMVVPIDSSPKFSPGRPELLFEGDFHPSPWYGRNYDVAEAGQKFLMVETALPDDLEAELKVVVNWQQLLEGN